MFENIRPSFSVPRGAHFARVPHKRLCRCKQDRLREDQPGFGPAESERRMRYRKRSVGRGRNKRRRKYVFVSEQNMATLHMN